MSVVQGKPSLVAVRNNPEAENLLTAMLHPVPKQRPSMEAVMAHPFWWRHDRRLAFLLNVSDRVELEDREVSSRALPKSPPPPPPPHPTPFDNCLCALVWMALC